MAYKILTPKELLAMTLAQVQKIKTPGFVDPNPSKKPTNTPVAVAPTPLVDLPGSGGAYDKAMLASIFGPATAPAVTAPVYTPPVATVPDWQPAFAQYQQSATKAANNAIDAQIAGANSTINGGGIWATLQPIAAKQMQDSIATLGQISAIAKGNVEASRTALNVQEAADYDAVIKSIDTSIIAARHRTNEEMNQRGMFFSTVLDAAMGTVEAAGTTQKGQAAGQNKAALAKIASDMAVMSANIDIETIKGNASAVAQYTASMLQVVAQDATTKQTAQALLASLNVQKAGVVDTIAAQTFATGQQMQATAFSQQEQLNADATNAANTAFSQQAQLRGEATDAANTAFTQNLQTNAATADATTTAQNEFIAGMGQYANDYRAAANALDPNDPLYAFKEGMLESAHNQKAEALTAAQAAAVLQQAKDKAAAAQQTFDNILNAAKVDISSASQQATAAYQSGQLNIAQYNAATSRMNADTSRYNATKPAAGTSSTGGLTYAQAMGNIDDYTKLQTTKGNLHPGGDGNYYEWVPNPNQANIDPLTGKSGPTINRLVDVKTLNQQIAELEPAYRASIAVRDKTSGTTTPLPLNATETANVEGFFTKVNSKANEMYGSSTVQSVDKAAYKLDYAQAFLKQYGALYNEREEKAIIDRFNGK